VPTFRFEAAHDDSRLEKGELEADSARAARTALRARGLVPISVEALTAAGDAGRLLKHGRMRASDLAVATRQLASLLTAGLPLDVALATLVDQSDGEVQRQVFRAVRADVTSGHRFAEALSRHPRVFPPVFVATVSAGEQAGSFGTVLERLADYLEERQALRSKLLAAATYPAIVTVIALGIVLFLMTYVVPQVVEVFEQTRQSLPWPTRALLAVSAFLRTFGIGLVGAAAAGVYLFRRALSRSSLRAAWDARLLSLPLFGRIVRGVDTTRFASTLAMLVEAGVPMLRALAAAEATLTNSTLRAAVQDAIGRVREGVGLARALGPAKAFPPVLVRLIEVGEATGQLPRMLSHAARIQSREVERRATAAATLLEPLLILAMGALVLAIVLAVLMPIIEINTLVR
jgi:general secretion pathway protein F